MRNNIKPSVSFDAVKFPEESYEITPSKAELKKLMACISKNPIKTQSNDRKTIKSFMKAM